MSGPGGLVRGESPASEQYSCSSGSPLVRPSGDGATESHPRGNGSIQGSPSRLPAATHPNGNRRSAPYGCTWYHAYPSAATGPSTTYNRTPSGSSGSSCFESAPTVGRLRTRSPSVAMTTPSVSRPSAPTTNGDAVPDGDAGGGAVEGGGMEPANDGVALDPVGVALGLASPLELADEHAAATARITANMTACDANRSGFTPCRRMERLNVAGPKALRRRQAQPPASWIQIVFVSVYWSWAWSDLSWPPKPDSL